jgi:FtsH-binding integral membrane protein
MSNFNVIKPCLLAEATALIGIGLWDVFALGLGPIDKVGMLQIFPQVFPILIGTILLFILPLSEKQPKFWIWIAVLLNVFVCLAAIQLSMTADAGKMIRMLIILVLTVAATVLYLLFLRSRARV